MKPAFKRNLRNKISTLERKLNRFKERLNLFPKGNNVNHVIQEHIAEVERDLKNAKFHLNR